MNAAAPEQLFCRTCERKTNHLCVAEHVRLEEEEPLPGHVVWGEITYRLWVCQGCDTGTLEQSLTSSEAIDPDGTQLYDRSYFPRRSPADLAAKHFWKLPKKLQRIYQEVIETYNGELHVLCAGGLRALLEGICHDKAVAGANLEARIDGLVAHLPENIVKNLHSFRFIGNVAMHELDPPTREELRLAIAISEDLLNFLYELDYKTTSLAMRRQKKNPATPGN